MTGFRSGILVGLAVAVIAAPAQAQNSPQEKAREYYKQAQAQYDLGNWAKAIELYKLSYESYPASALLFNIGQAYRQWGNCQQALFFYRRYLANEPNAPNKRVVEELIEDQKKACEGRQKDPTTPIPPAGGGSGTTGSGKTGSGTTGSGTTGSGTTGSGTTGSGTTGSGTTGSGTTGSGTGSGTTTATVGDDDDDDDDDDDLGVEDGVSLTAPARPRLLAANLSLGGSFVSFGDPDLETDPLFAFALGAGYPLDLGPLGLEVGAMLTYTPIPWENESMQSGTASLTGLLANVGAVFPIPTFPRLSIRGDVGLGVQLFGGLTEEGVVFLEDGERATGMLTTFHARIAGGAEFAVTPNVVINAFPVVFAYSPSGELRDTISSVTRFELLVGAGYKM
jgi:hypothetical protein